MTTVNVNVTDVAGAYGPNDKIVFYSPVYREGNSGEIISTAETVFSLQGGPGTVELEPGPVRVKFQVQGISDIKDKEGVVPDNGIVDLYDVIAASFTYTPPITNDALERITTSRDEAILEVLRTSALVGAVLTEHGAWEPGIQYPAGAVVEHEEKRWYGSAEFLDIPERTNLLVDPQMRRLTWWSKFSGVSTVFTDEKMVVSLASNRPQRNGILTSTQNVEVASGQALSASMLVHNPGSAAVSVRLGLAVDTEISVAPNIYGDSTTIPAGETARIVATGTMPEGFGSVKLQLTVGETMMPAGTVLHASQAIVEKSDAAGSYFDGDTDGASWLGTPRESSSLLPAHREMTLPTGEPGVNDSWVLLSILLDDGAFPIITDAGMWSEEGTYQSGNVVTYNGARWIGTSVSHNYPERTNIVLDPKIDISDAWTAYPNVNINVASGATLTLVASRPSANGIMVGSANYQIPVVAGDPISAGIMVENRSSATLTVRAGFVFYPGSTQDQGADVTIPAGATARVTCSSAVPSGQTAARLALFSGSGGVTAGSVLHVSKAIVEKSESVGDYFDGDTEGAQWILKSYGAASYSPARQEINPPTGVPGVDPAWVLISSEVDGVEDIVARLDALDTSVQEVNQAKTDAVAASELASAQASASAEARTAAETASATTLNILGEISTTASAVQANRDHVDAQVESIDTAFTDSVPPYLTKTTLDQTYASEDTVAGIESRTAPQKMVFDLPVPQPHREPNLAIQRALPDGDENVQVIFTEGDVLWGWGRDRSLYKMIAGQWQHRAYLAGMGVRGGMARCQDGSLLYFSSSYTIRRSTDEGKTWADVLPRRDVGLEPLSTQSMVVQPNTGHVYYGEYTNGTPESVQTVVLWRSVDHGETWQQFHVWPHSRSGAEGRITHIHAVQVDPYTNDVYVMAGDGTPSTGIWKVSGETCIPLLTNGMVSSDLHDAPRAIGVMFFPDYVAWGSDSTTNPYLFRIPRAALGSDPSQLHRGVRLSSTAWGTARASEDGSRWVMFSSDEAYPDYAADRMAHIYAVEDQGATVYEIGSIPSRVSSGVTTLMPLAQPEKYGLDFWFSMRTGQGTYYGAWQARIGYGGQTIPWPTQPKTTVTQSQSSGLVTVPAASTVFFGVTRAPVYATNLAIYESTAYQIGGVAGTAQMVAMVDGVEVYSSVRTSARAQGRLEYGGPVSVVNVAANKNVEFRIKNGHGTSPCDATGSITYAWT